MTTLPHPFPTSMPFDPDDPLQLRVQPIRFVMPRITPPLDLDAQYFRYRIDRDGRVHTLPSIAGARVCREKSLRRRRRSLRVHDQPQQSL